MAHLDSPHWYGGICNKHYLPSIPCPQCIADKDEDIEVVFTDMDRCVLQMDPGVKPSDLVPMGFENHIGGFKKKPKRIYVQEFWTETELYQMAQSREAIWHSTQETPFYEREEEHRNEVYWWLNSKEMGEEVTKQIVWRWDVDVFCKLIYGKLEMQEAQDFIQRITGCDCLVKFPDFFEDGSFLELENADQCGDGFFFYYEKTRMFYLFEQDAEVLGRNFVNRKMGWDK